MVIGILALLWYFIMAAVSCYVSRAAAPEGTGQDEGRIDGWTDGTYRFPLYSTGLCPLRFPSGPLPCLHYNYHQEIPEQGKGTDDHLLPLGDWFTSEFSLRHKRFHLQFYNLRPPRPHGFPYVPTQY